MFEKIIQFRYVSDCTLLLQKSTATLWTFVTISRRFVLQQLTTIRCVEVLLTPRNIRSYNGEPFLQLLRMAL